MSQSLKMLVLDLDGTILNDKKEIIPENLKAMQELKKHNPETLICVATGRSFRTSIRFAREIGVDFLITHDGKAIYSKINDKKYTLDKVFHMSEQESSAISNKIKKPLKRVLCKAKTPMIGLWSKLSVLKHQMKSGFSFNGIKKHYKYIGKGKDKISYFSPFPTMKGIFTPLGVDKGNAIIYLMEELKKRGMAIKRSEVAIIGNDYNDFDMLKLEGCQSYCPANAIKQIKDLDNVSSLKGNNNEPWINELLEDFKTKPSCKTDHEFLDKFLAKAKKNFPEQNIKSKNKSSLDIAR